MNIVQFTKANLGKSEQFYLASVVLWLVDVWVLHDHVTVWAY